MGGDPGGGLDVGHEQRAVVGLDPRAAQGGGMGAGLMGIGKSRARRYDQDAQTKVTFNDVADTEAWRQERLSRS